MSTALQNTSAAQMMIGKYIIVETTKLIPYLQAPSLPIRPQEIPTSHLPMVRFPRPWTRFPWEHDLQLREEHPCYEEGDVPTLVAEAVDDQEALYSDADSSTGAHQAPQSAGTQPWSREIRQQWTRAADCRIQRSRPSNPRVRLEVEELEVGGQSVLEGFPVDLVWRTNDSQVGADICHQAGRKRWQEEPDCTPESDGDKPTSSSGYSSRCMRWMKRCESTKPETTKNTATMAAPE
ncbi:hypothetical protein DL771_006185 [Monosporascus sp. 5C6A]|nr:hypothetical protein DL771_006185 [Monosporascus sp. 5C6A]